MFAEICEFWKVCLIVILLKLDYLKDFYFIFLLNLVGKFSKKLNIE